jgi:hypothetical protein
MAKRDPDHPWADEADSLIPRDEIPEPVRVPGVISVYHVATTGVRVREVVVEGFRALVCTLATNPLLRDFTIDCERGVDAQLGIEVPPAQRALVARTLAELVRADTLRAWLAREEKARGGGKAGRGALVDALVDVAPPPPGRTRAHLRGGIMRAVQRVSEPRRPGRKQSHATIRSRDYWERINLLRGGPSAAVGRIVALAQGQLRVRGDWVISSDTQACVWKRTDYLDPVKDPTVRDVLLNGGDGLLVALEAWLARELEKVHQPPLQLARCMAMQIQVREA